MSGTVLAYIKRAGHSSQNSGWRACIRRLPSSNNYGCYCIHYCSYYNYFSSTSYCYCCTSSFLDYYTTVACRSSTAVFNNNKKHARLSSHTATQLYTATQ